MYMTKKPVNSEASHDDRVSGCTKCSRAESTDASGDLHNVLHHCDCHKNGVYTTHGDVTFHFVTNIYLYPGIQSKEES